VLSAIAAMTVANPQLGVLLWPLLGMVPLCCGCGCGNCTTTFSSQYQVDIAGVSDLGSNCLDCSQYNATYILDKVSYATVAAGSADDCWARAEINPCYCWGASANSEGADESQAVNQIRFASIVSGANSILQVTFGSNTIGADCHTIRSDLTTTWLVYQKTVASGANCGNLSSESITFNSDSPGHPGIGCQSDGTAAVVTSI
jgi:hypothetical protein